jgi:hypothetical protein
MQTHKNGQIMMRNDKAKQNGKQTPRRERQRGAALHGETRGGTQAARRNREMQLCKRKLSCFFINVESNTHSFLASLGLLQFEESGEKRKISSRTIQNGQKRPERTKMRTNLREENDKSTLLDVI